MRIIRLAACALVLLVAGSASPALDIGSPGLRLPIGDRSIAEIPPDNGRLGLFADPEGTQRCATVPMGSIGYLYLFADLEGETEPGITGMEFRIQITNPSGYQFFYTPPPASNILLGNPFDLTPGDPRDRGGANLAFPSCQTGPRVPMGSILVLNSAGGPTQMLVVRRNQSTNPFFPCPWFTRCDVPSYSGICMGPCAVDLHGLQIASRLTLNDSACTEPESCPVSCPGTPCVDLVADGPSRGCIGEPIAVQATATNCSSSPEDIELYIDYELAGSFTDVPPGGVVNASRTLAMPDCAPSNNVHVPVGAVARNAACPEPFGLEKLWAILCDSRVCGGNLPPDCSAARASVEELLPHNKKLVPVSIVGIVDPNDDPLEIVIEGVESDEPPGEYGDRNCPDAFFDGPNEVRLRAELDPRGNGRVYTLRYRAREPSGLYCRGEAKVCVPKNRNLACVDDGPNYGTRYCTWVAPRGGDLLDGIRVVGERGGGAEISFATTAASPVRLEVYDIRGRLVRELDGRYPAGSHALRWDGRDGSGQSAAAGIYLFRMQVGERAYTAKTVILR